MRETLLRASAFLALLFITSVSFSQITWSDDVAAIIYNNCSVCHHEGAIAPFPLMSYNDAIDNSVNIQIDVNSKKMPPWPADPNCNHFWDERVLTDSEIATINE